MIFGLYSLRSCTWHHDSYHWLDARAPLAMQHDDEHAAFCRLIARNTRRAYARSAMPVS